jgi:N-acetylglucosaminyldiphosphoundecaprenol N-acetyl-beta-D-mannosaminyltransferase
MRHLDVPVCMGVGGSFDMLAGRVRRAPVWMQRHGLEWAYRVMQEPTRLWKRYFIDDMPVFLRLMVQRRTGTPTARSVTGMLTETISRPERTP